MGHFENNHFCSSTIGPLKILVQTSSLPRKSARIGCAKMSYGGGMSRGPGMSQGGYGHGARSPGGSRGGASRGGLAPSSYSGIYGQRFTSKLTPQEKELIDVAFESFKDAMGIPPRCYERLIERFCARLCSFVNRCYS